MTAAPSTDLLVVPHFAAHDASDVDLALRGHGDRVDLQTVADRENLAQALVLRLLTPRGSLAALGHAAYGSRLHELVGREKTGAVRHLCRVFVLEAVAQEPRVESEAVAFAFRPDEEGPSSIAFTLSVRPRGGAGPVALDLEVGV